MKYNRASLTSTLQAAQKLSYASYVFATAYGYLISRSKPDFNQNYLSVENGKVTEHTYNLRSGTWSTEELQ